jgi:hypothetical protein
MSVKKSCYEIEGVCTLGSAFQVLAALIDRGAAVIMTFLFGLIFSRVLLSDAKFAKVKS